MVQRVTYLVRVLGPDDPPDVGQVRAGHRLALRVRRAVFVLGVVLAAHGAALLAPAGHKWLEELVTGFIAIGHIWTSELPTPNGYDRDQIFELHCRQQSIPINFRLN